MSVFAGRSLVGWEIKPGSNRFAFGGFVTKQVFSERVQYCISLFLRRQ